MSDTATATGRIAIEGGSRLEGTARIPGSKNVGLHLIAATSLVDEACIDGVPDIADIPHCVELLRASGLEVVRDGGSLRTHREHRRERVALDPYHGSRIRPTACFAIAALGGTNEVVFPAPGGDSFCPRPIDLHLAHASRAGVDVSAVEGGWRLAAPDTWRGATYPCGTQYGPSLGATVSALFLASLSAETSLLTEASVEPEVLATAEMLRRAGARVDMVAPSTFEVVGGASSTSRVEVTNLPDRLVAGTAVLLTAATGGRTTLLDCDVADLPPGFLELCVAAGIRLQQVGGALVVDGRWSLQHPVHVTTEPHPGYPSDVQPQLTAALTQAAGTSTVRETIYPSRWSHVDQLAAAGANLAVAGDTVRVVGPAKLTAQSFRACDIRTDAALVTAASVAVGRSEIDLTHLRRGYPDLVRLLSDLGVQVTTIPMR